MAKICILFGGESNEREISVITGTYVCNLLRLSKKHEVVPLFLTRKGEFIYCPKLKSVADFSGDVRGTVCTLGCGGLYGVGKKKPFISPDLYLNALHGGMGEDGTVSALLRFYGLKSISPETPISSVFMNKEYARIASIGLSVPVVESEFIREEEWRGDGARFLGKERSFPVIVKPVHLGSSIGISVAKNAEELTRALNEAFRLDFGAIVQKYLPDKRDVNVAVYRTGNGIVSSECEEVTSSGNTLSFDDKYRGRGAKSVRPAPIPDETATKLKEYAEKLYSAFDGQGVVRFDFLLSGDEVYFNELNTVPGLLALPLFCRRMTEMKTLLEEWIEEGLYRQVVEKEKVESGILRAGVFEGAKS